MVRRSLLAVGLAAALSQPATADDYARFGTAMKIGLPLAAAICAADQGRLEDFAVRGLIQAVVVRGLKRLFDGTPIGTRPDRATEIGRGFPSGHTAAAAFGAADLAGKCAPDDVAAGAAAYGAAGLTGFSRIHAGEHTAQQVWAGALIGFSFGAADFGIGTDGVSFSVGMRF